MNAFPDDYVFHNLPLIVLSGLEEEQDDSITGGKVRTWLSEGGFRIKTDLPSVKGTTAQVLLQSLLSHDSSDRPWHSRGVGQGEQPAVFRIHSVGRTYTLPPRKAGPPAHSPRLRPANDGSSPPPQLILHSTISPLTPSSPLYPDGIMTPFWVTKHQARLPSIFVSFFALVADSNTSTLQDNKLKSEINNIRSVLTSTNYKTRLVVVLICDGDLQGSEVEERLNNIRRATNLDAKSIFFVAAGLPQPDILEFCKAMLSSLYPVCIEYYRDLSKHARRKRNRNVQPQPTIPPSSSMAKPLPLASWNVRYEFKLAVFAEFRQETEAALRSYEAAYESLFGPEVFDTVPSWSSRFNETRMLADIIVIRIIRCVLWLGQTTNAVKWWLNHRNRMRSLVERRGAGTETYGWEAWQSVWSTVMAEAVHRSQVLSPAGANSSANTAPLLFVDAEKTLPATQRYSPWESLHHEGYWLLISQKHTLARRDRASMMSEGDRGPPRQTPTLATASKAHLHDKYLALEPYQELPLDGKQGYDYSSEIIQSLETAINNFSIRGQVRMAEIWQLKKAAELMRMNSWNESFTLLLSVWESQAWRKSGWWMLLESVGNSLLTCALQLDKPETVTQVKWQLAHPVFSPYLLKNPEAEGMESAANISTSLDTEHTLSLFTASFAFATDECHVGEATGVQITLHRADANTSDNFQLMQVKVVFEGGLKPISLVHDDPKPVNADEDGTTITEVKLEETHAGSAALVSADVDLKFQPGHTKVFQAYVIPHEAGDVSVAFVAMLIQDDAQELTITSSDVNDTPGKWWELRGGKPISRPCGRQRDAAAAKVLPKPPKVELNIVETRKNFYTNESIKLTVQARNDEEETVSGSIEARLLSPGRNNALVRWGDDETAAVSPTTDDITFVQKLPVRHIEELEVGAGTAYAISISNTDEAIDHELEITIRYTLSSNPETKLSKVLTLDMPVLRPFEANFSFHARLHEEHWPNFFSAQSVSGSEDSITGIKQKYLVTAIICSFALEEVVIESTNLTAQKIVGSAVCTMTPGALLQGSPPSQSPENDPLILVRSEETKKFGFDMTLQKSTLGNRDPVAVDVLLEIRWRRKVSDQVNTSILQVPRFLASSVEPRVLLQVAQEQHMLGVYRLDYTIENPSFHFLTFNLTMESSDDFAFSGIKAKSLSLVPVSRVEVVYRIMPTKKKAWIKVQLGVVDAYFTQTLKTQPASDGVRIDKQGNVLVWVE